MKRWHLSALCGLSLLMTATPPTIRAAGPDAKGVEFFETNVRPVLVEQCYSCHSAATKQRGGLSLDSKAAVLAGGDSGPALVPGKPKESLILKALRGEGTEQMPPKGKLSPEVVKHIEQWIEMGAPDPRDGSANGPRPVDLAAGRQFWSMQPVRKVEPPAVKNVALVRNEIDRFILARLEADGLAPVDPAGKRELLRRATFDLTGLPPIPEEIDAFLKDESPEAFAKVVDRLLASPAYGERWGRYWLDVARYAEDQAHTFAVQPNTNAWRYRDWVVGALNADMPYDRFVKLQIAADAVPGLNDEQRREQLAALGFFGLGAQYYKNTDAAKAAADELDDRIDTLTRGFLGLTVSCARCHDHKFDPIPTQDYYSLAGVFSSSKLANLPLASQESVNRYNEAQRLIKEADARVKGFLATEKQRLAESRVGEVAKYLVAVWAAKATPMAEVAKESKLDAGKLSRWAKFVENPGNDPAKAALDAFKKLPPPAKKGDDPTPEVVKAAEAVESAFRQALSVRDGMPDPKGGPGTPKFVSKVLNKFSPVATVEVDVTGAKVLVLAANDAGDGKMCDWIAWAEPKLVGPKGEVKLTDLKWNSEKGGVQKDRNYGGQPIRLAGKPVEYGLGGHAPSVVEYDIPEGMTKFVARCGLDNGGADQPACGEQASVQFKVYTDKPAGDPTAFGGGGKLSKPQQDLLTAVFGEKGPLAVADNEVTATLDEPKKAKMKALTDELTKLQKESPPAPPIVHGLSDASVADMKVFVRGNPAKQGDLAPRRFLKVIAGDEPAKFAHGSGRLDLAEVIATKENPLTARVLVNRVWAWHFGRGIVGTPSNFGTLGERPTHPELLDWLAATFVEDGWSLKKLHRRIMLSGTYQLSTRRDDKNMTKDADNRTLWRFNRKRLDVEAWRDALLAVSGRLDATIGGPTTNLDDPNNRRRTLYAKISRHDLSPLLRLFDFPDANITAEKRTETTVPQQQLFVLNSPFFVEQAKSLAARVQKEAADDPARVRLAFLLAYGRPARDSEVELSVKFLAATDPEGEQNKLTRWERLTQAILGGNEFIYLD